MNPKTALAACQALGIGIVSAIALFFAHRALISDDAPSDTLPGASGFASGDGTDPSAEPAATDGGRDERLARADDRGEAVSESGAGHAAGAGERAGGGPGGLSAGRRDDDVLPAGRGGADDLPAVRAERAPTGEQTNPHLDALRHPSPAYRNVTLATVIQSAGHPCTSVLSSAAGHDDLTSWRVSCEGGHAYFVFADGDELRVEPMVYFDMPTPFVPVEPSESQPRLLPPPQ